MIKIVTGGQTSETLSSQKHLTMMLTAVDSLCFIRTCITPDNGLFTVKYAEYFETLIYIDIYIYIYYVCVNIM